MCSRFEVVIECMIKGLGGFLKVDRMIDVIAFMVVNNLYSLNGSSSGVICLKFQGANLVLVKLGHK